MKQLLLIGMLMWAMTIPVCADTIEAPTAPQDVMDLMPAEQNSFGEDLWYVVRSAAETLEPELAQCATVCVRIMVAVILVSVLGSVSGSAKSVTELAGAVTVAVILISTGNTLIASASGTVQSLSDYGKLLLPVMTTAMAAQGGVTGSAALYTGTAVFDAVLSSLISWALVPMIYTFLVLAIANAALGEELLGKLKGFLKWLCSWGLKIILYVFTGYMTITGVISGTADQTALKAAKLTISGMVPVVGGILSDASETILISAGTVKNAVGVYGMTALIAIAIGPFLRIGIQYLMLKITGSVCGTFGAKRITELIMDVSAAMGLLLAMTGTVCLMLVISVVCFMKGMS